VFIGFCAWFFTGVTGFSWVTLAFRMPPLSTVKLLHMTEPEQLPVDRIISSFVALTSPSNFPPMVRLETWVLALTDPSSAMTTFSPSSVPSTAPLMIRFPLLEIDPSILRSLSRQVF